MGFYIRGYGAKRAVSVFFAAALTIGFLFGLCRAAEPEGAVPAPSETISAPESLPPVETDGPEDPSPEETPPPVETDGPEDLSPEETPPPVETDGPEDLLPEETPPPVETDGPEDPSPEETPPPVETDGPETPEHGAAPVLPEPALEDGAALSIELGAALGDPADYFIVEGYKITGLDKENFLAALEQNGGELVIPDTIELINPSIFQGIEQLTKLTVPDLMIGEYAFAGCINLRQITFTGTGAQFLTLGAGAFNGCIALTTLDITCNGYGPSSTDFNVFVDCPIEIININSNTAFGLFKNLNKPKSLSTLILAGKDMGAITSDAFKGCGNVTALEVQLGSFYSIASGAFDGLNITTMVISGHTNGYTQYDSNIFPKTLTSLTITGDGYDRLGLILDSFNNCVGLTTINLNSNSAIKAFNTLFASPSSSSSEARKRVTTIHIGEGVTTIDNSTFSSCSNLSEITLPDTLTSIGSSAFSYCTNLQSITIPSSVTKIEDYCFYECGNLQEITLPSSLQMGKNSFYRVFPKKISILVPADTKPEQYLSIINEMKKKLIAGGAPTDLLAQLESISILAGNESVNLSDTIKLDHLVREYASAPYLSSPETLWTNAFSDPKSADLNGVTSSTGGAELVSDSLMALLTSTTLNDNYNFLPPDTQATLSGLADKLLEAMADPVKTMSDSVSVTSEPADPAPAEG